MSGIFGIYDLDGRPVDRTDLEAMSARLAHRGPDGANLWNEGPLGLGHRMLHTTPESLQERLPLVKENGKLVITADARIDNRDELLSALNASAPLDKSISDSELILLAYEKWGTTCPARLLGDFAFAIWDAKRQKIFCARDHLGGKPFYYYLSNQIFIFASELKALLCLEKIPCKLNENRVADHLAALPIYKSTTFYQDLLRLPTGHTLTLSRGQIRLEVYWSLDPMREIHYKTNEEYAEAFRNIFTQAVSTRLRSAFPVGSMLSGGLDSSSIVCTANQLLAKNGNRPLHTFSAVFDGDPKGDERPYINAVLALGGMQPHYIHAEHLSPLTDWKRVFYHQDEPYFSPFLFMHQTLHDAAQKQGVRVLLDGFGGDGTVSHGTAYLTQLALQGRWLNLASQIHGLSINSNESVWNILRNFVLPPLTPPFLGRFWRALHGRDKPTWARYNPTIRADFVRRNGIKELAQNHEIQCFRALRNGRTNHYAYIDNPDGVACAYETFSKSAAAFSVESRYPFCDRRLIEFCLALPGKQKIHKGWTRIVMRRAMDGVLPEKIRWRGDKGNPAYTFRCNLATLGRSILDDVIIRNPGVIETYIDVSVLRQIYQRYLSQREQTDALTIWQAVTLALWLRGMHASIRRKICSNK